MSKCISIFRSPITLLSFVFIFGCQSKLKTNSTEMNYEKGTFGYDKVFLQKHFKNTIILENTIGGQAIIVSPELQGRVMTSTLGGDTGISFGWINYDLIESQIINPQMNAFGGEERFWLGPEGGQYGLYFPKADGFDFADWVVPPVIDIEPFEVVNKSENSVLFKKNTILSNYSGTTFEIEINREVILSSQDDIFQRLGLKQENISAVAYQTKNTVRNLGDLPWTEKTGAISIWLLCMFNPSPQAVVVLPIVQGKDDVLGPRVNDNYFGKISEDRLKITDKTIFFKADGKSRGKIGISPQRAEIFSGSYDGDNQILTILEINQPNSTDKYVNSAWEIQQNPFSGDVINSYNDGPLENGDQLGPFYELESSSPALLLNPNESHQHIQHIYHFSGSVEVLSEISQKLLGVSITEIKETF
ncbi:MAG: hypothetical protein OXC03_06990 [Flavobacteriaceae bacterium]|nr:hypothetical protein [Flavobacteriaceae bacterium]